MRRTINLIFSALAGILAGCTRVPSGLQPVTGFELQRYLGTWHEIARLDHSFEHGLTHVTAEYVAGDDGSITVINRGYDPAAGKWRESRGIARFIGSDTIGSLKVSFFRPFWGGYHILALDQENYRYSLIAGPSRSYLWILARERALDPQILSDLVTKARQWGFTTEKLIYVNQTPAPNP